MPAGALKILLIRAGKKSGEARKIYRSTQGINRITVSEIQPADGEIHSCKYTATLYL